MSKSKNIKIGKNVIQIEAEALLRIKEKIDNEFNKAVDLCYDTKGKIVVIGMGKSGIVGQKITATLASTGTQSQFIHPAEALHGDIGMVSNNDTIITGGYGPTSQEVIIPAFLAAYSGKSPLNIGLTSFPAIPLPNWRINYDGLMIESHWDPDNAWSDAAQQVTPERLIEIMRDLKIRDKTSQGEDYQNRLNNLRSQIDAADQNLLTTLGKRMEVAKGIGKLKSENNVAILQNKRWNEILGKMILDGEDHGLSEEFILRIFKAIHQESINNQKKILKK